MEEPEGESCIVYFEYLSENAFQLKSFKSVLEHTVIYHFVSKKTSLK